MAYAADIDDTINLTVYNVTRLAVGQSSVLHAQLLDWWATFAQFDEDNEQQRTVRNWKVPTQFVLDRLPSEVTPHMEWCSDICMVVYQACCAAKYAAADGRTVAADAVSLPLSRG